MTDKPANVEKAEETSIRNKRVLTLVPEYTD